MFVIALTGGLGAGKSTAARYFQSRGAVVLSLDEIAQRILEPGSELLARVADEFGTIVLEDDGSLDRPALALAAFASPERAAALNAIVHPAVAREVGPALREIRLMPHQPEVVVMEVPMLVEAPVFAEMSDAVLAIEAPVEERVRRAVASGMDEGDARRRVLVQASDADRAAVADDVIENDGDTDEFRARLEAYWDERVALAGDR